MGCVFGLEYEEELGLGVVIVILRALKIQREIERRKEEGMVWWVQKDCLLGRVWSGGAASFDWIG